MDWITSALRSVGEFFGWARGRSEFKNKPDIKERKERQAEVDRVSESERAVMKRDIDRIREELGE